MPLSVAFNPGWFSPLKTAIRGPLVDSVMGFGGVKWSGAGAVLWMGREGFLNFAEAAGVGGVCDVDRSARLVGDAKLLANSRAARRPIADLVTMGPRS